MIDRIRKRKCGGQTLRRPTTTRRSPNLLRADPRKLQFGGQTQERSDREARTPQ